jgi:hypothetical protein
VGGVNILKWLFLTRCLPIQRSFFHLVLNLKGCLVSRD